MESYFFAKENISENLEKINKNYIYLLSLFHEKHIRKTISLF